MKTSEWILLVMALGAVWIGKEVVLSWKTTLVFPAKNKNTRIAAIALLCIPLMQVLFPDPSLPLTAVTLPCNVVIGLAGLLMFTAKTGVAEDMLLMGGLRYRFEKLTEFQVSRNNAKGRSELLFRTKHNQRRLFFDLKDYSAIQKFMAGKKPPSEKKKLPQNKEEKPKDQKTPKEPRLERQ